MRAGVLTATLVLVLSGCGGADEEAGTESADTSSSNDSTTSVTPASPAITGSWQRITTCADRVQALKRAGLEEFAAEHAAGEGWIPGVSDPRQIEDPQHPCEGAVPLKHGHFFTEDGLFGSTGDQGEQVDDGTYRATDTKVVITGGMGDVTFNYEIQDGALFLDPVMPKCAKSGCFAAQWAVAVAYPGLPWDRVE